MTCLTFSLAAQENQNSNGEHFQESTVTDFLNSKYKWEPPKQEERPKLEIVNDTPLKTIAEKEAIIEVRLKPTLNIDDPTDAIPEDEMGLDTVELREFRVTELYSPLMRMSELKDLEKLDPASGGAYLSEEYFTQLENQYLNRWTIPLIGKSQEQLAKERYNIEQYQQFLGEVSVAIDNLDKLNPEYAKEIRKEFQETQHQYNNNFKINDNRFTNPDAKF
tara:strand:- start:581 stop:1240 length:660 start_codon:yes stop_codon:yes gene_type:complete